MWHVVFFEPDVSGGRSFVGPFPDVGAALAYVAGGNLPDGFERAGVVPLLPVRADATEGAVPGRDVCASGCGRQGEVAVVATRTSISIPLCRACAEPYEADRHYRVVGR